MNEVYAAFAGAPRPSSKEIPDNDSEDGEREEIRDLLAPHAVHDVPTEELGRYPLYTMFPFLSAAAYRYYMPRFIEYCVEHPNSMLSESLLFSLARENDDRVAEFPPMERAVVREYLDHIAVGAHAKYDREYIETARKQWK